MAKRRQKRQPRNGKDQAGCISGLISIFDFRHGRTARKLLSDRRGKRHSKGAECSQSELVPSHSRKYQDSRDAEERIASADTGKTNVKKLMEEEMSNEQGQNLMNAPEEAANIRENSQSRNKTFQTVDGADIYDLDPSKDLVSEESCHQNNKQKMVEDYDLELVLQEICQILEKSCSGVMHLKNDYDMHSNQPLKIDKEKLNTVIKVLLDQSSHDNHVKEDAPFQQSSVFMEALHKLGSQKDLFLKLLQDPNSLNVKQTEGLEEAILEKDPSFKSLLEFGFLKEKPIHSKTDEVINHKSHKFFRRSKLHGSLPSLGNEKCQPSNKVVILKPGLAALQEPDSEVSVSSSVLSHRPTVNKIEGEKSRFSFNEIKRKLKHAIRKERQVIAPNGIAENFQKENRKHREFEKGFGGENVEWCSPNRNHFFTERYTKLSVGLKKKETLGKLNHTESLTASSDTLRPEVSNIYIEAKKHLLEMIGSGDNYAQKISGQPPKSLGRILSLSEYEFSPTCSPCKDEDVGFASDQTRPSCSRNSQTISESSHQIAEEIYSQPSPSRHCSISQSYLTHDSSSEEVELPMGNEGIVRIEEVINHVCQEGNDNAVNSDESDSFCSLRDAEVDYAAEGCDNMLTEQLITQSSVDSEMLSSLSASPSHSCVPFKIENLNRSVDRTERPSPVSVLDPLFAEEDVSPARTVSQPVEIETLPRQIDFSEERSSNDQEICLRISSDDNETAFEYVEAVLLGSGLNWDEFLLRWLSSCTVLDSVLYDEVELFSSKPQHEQRMLFDCTNEVLEELCERYSRSFRGMSCIGRNVCAVPKGMDLILEIWEEVERHLLRCPLPQSLEQLIKKDMGSSRAWMDLRLDIECIGIEVENEIIKDLVEDTISSSICGTSDSNFVTFSEDLTDPVAV